MDTAFLILSNALAAGIIVCMGGGVFLVMLVG